MNPYDEKTKPAPAARIEHLEAQVEALRAELERAEATIGRLTWMLNESIESNRAWYPDELLAHLERRWAERGGV